MPPEHRELRFIIPVSQGQEQTAFPTLIIAQKNKICRKFWKMKKKKSQWASIIFFPFLFNRYILPRQDRRRVTLPVCVFITSGNHNKPFLQCAVTRTCTAFALHVTEMKINPDRTWEAEEETRTSLPP